MLAWFALIGCSGGTLEGRVVDGLTGLPLADFAVMAKATEPTSMGCTAFSAKTGADGRFSIAGSCSVAYALSPVKSDAVDVWFASGELIEKDAKAPVEIQAWKTPSAPGVYRMSAGEFEPLRKVADVKTRELSGTAENVKFPAKLADKITLFSGSDLLVLVGKDNVEGLAPVPLVENKDVVLKQGKFEVTQTDWLYLGVRITAGHPPAVQQVGARFEPSKVKTVSKGERAVAFIPADALEAGRYGLLKPADTRIYILDFGSTQASPGDPPAPEPADAGGPVEAPG